MKTFYLLLLSILLYSLSVTPLMAQDMEVMQNYNRPTITNLCLVFGDETDHEQKVRETFKMLPSNPKFNLADMDFYIDAGLSTNDSLAMYNFTQKTDVKNKLRRLVSKKFELYPADDEVGLAIRAYLEENTNIGGEIMAQWAKQENGEFVTIKERSEQNMTVADYQKKTDAQKLEVYEDMLRSNFVIVYNVSDWRSNKEKGMKRNVRFNGSNVSQDEIVATVHAFIYKIAISDEQFGKEIAPNFGNISKVKSFRYPVEYIGHTKVTEAFVPRQRYGTAKTLKNISSFKLGKKKKAAEEEVILRSKGADAQEITTTVNTMNAANETGNVDWENLDFEAKENFTYQHITGQVFDGIVELIEMSISDFQVKTELTGSTPLQAPIGLKDGVKAGQRYRVYENVYKRGKGEVKTKSKGIVIATKVGDNRNTLIDPATNEPIVTEFKQVNGEILRENMIMVQDNDYGLSLSFGTQFGYFGNDFPSLLIGGRGETNVSNLVNKLVGKNKAYGLYSFIGFAFGTNKIENTDVRLNLINIDFGFSKRLYLNRKFDLIPEVGLTIGIPGYSSSETAEFSDEGIMFLNLGARFPVWIKENFAIEPAIELPIKISSNTFENPASLLHFALRGRMDF